MGKHNGRLMRLNVRDIPQKPFIYFLGMMSRRKVTVVVAKVDEIDAPVINYKFIYLSSAKKNKKKI